MISNKKTSQKTEKRKEVKSLLTCNDSKISQRASFMVFYVGFLIIPQELPKRKKLLCIFLAQILCNLPIINLLSKNKNLCGSKSEDSPIYSTASVEC